LRDTERAREFEGDKRAAFGVFLLPASPPVSTGGIQLPPLVIANY